MKKIVLIATLFALSLNAMADGWFDLIPAPGFNPGGGDGTGGGVINWNDSTILPNPDEPEGQNSVIGLDFTGSLFYGELSLTSTQNANNVEIYVVNESGAIVYSTVRNFRAGNTFEIFTNGWSTGAYTIYIVCDHLCLKGEFEVE